MIDPSTIETTPLSLDSFERFASLHANPSCNGCYCMYWHFAGDNRAWLLRLGEGAENREEKRALVSRGEAHGMIASVDGVPVASVQFAPRDGLVKLTRRMPYQNLAPDARVWALACFMVLPAWRKRGVARVLLDRAVAHLRDVEHAVAVEAFPRCRPPEEEQDMTDEEVWTGPASLYASAGFVRVRDHVSYPVFRKDLTAAGPTA